MSPQRGPKCRGCEAPIVFLRSPYTKNPRPFDPKPVDASHPLAGVRAFPVLGPNAYLPADLAEHLQVQRQTTLTAAQDEVRDLPWHLTHECPPDSPKDTP